MSLTLAQLKESGNKLLLLTKKILIKLKLIDSFTIELEMQKEDFIKELMNQVEEGYIGFFSSSFLEVFSSSNKKFKGHVKNEYFKIRRRVSFSDMNFRSTIARGSFKQKNDKLIIETEIMGFHGIKFFLYFFLFFVILILLSILFQIFNLFVSNNIAVWKKFGVILIFLLQLFIVIGVPYFIYNRSVKVLKNELNKCLVICQNNNKNKINNKT